MPRLAQTLAIDSLLPDQEEVRMVRVQHRALAPNLRRSMQNGFSTCIARQGIHSIPLRCAFAICLHAHM
eukprot:3406273-Rhodomonas_salina.1